ncbi:MAG: hypothetical protein QME49_01640 [bacterium]|nr:hypothetical protein [bacterium]
MIGQVNLEEYLVGLKLSTLLKSEAISQDIIIPCRTTYSMLFSTRPNYYSIERLFEIYSSLPRYLEVSYFIDDINSGKVFPSFKLLNPKRELLFLSKWIKSRFVKIVVSNVHRYLDAQLVIQAFPEYIDKNRMSDLVLALLGTYNYNIELPINTGDFSVSNFSPNYRCKTCLSGAYITYDIEDRINNLSFQDRISYEAYNATYFWGNGGHNCPLLHYTNKAQILQAIANGKIEAI